MSSKPLLIANLLALTPTEWRALTLRMSWWHRFVRPTTDLPDILQPYLDWVDEAPTWDALRKEVTRARLAQRRAAKRVKTVLRADRRRRYMRTYMRTYRERTT